jgi:hypothetical protein
MPPWEINRVCVIVSIDFEEFDHVDCLRNDLSSEMNDALCLPR